MKATSTRSFFLTALIVAIRAIEGFVLPPGRRAGHPRRLLGQWHQLAYASEPAPSRLFASSSESTITTERVPVGKIFNEDRTFLFSTKANLRNYEWSVVEAEQLLEDILLDAESACERHDSEGFELGPIIIQMKDLTREEIKQIGKPCGFYDVSPYFTFAPSRRTRAPVVRVQRITHNTSSA